MYRASTPRKRKQQHLLDVKVRSRKASQQRVQAVITGLCKVMLTVSVAAGIFYGAREGLRRFVWENPDYRLTDIQFTDDGGVLSRDQVLKAAGIKEGQNIFSINLPRARESLLKLSQVEHAELERVLPARIAITINERKPIAWIASRDDEDPSSSPNSFLVDKQGMLMKAKNLLPDYRHLPVICGVTGMDNLQAGETIDDFAVRAALDLVRLDEDNAVQTRFQVRSIDLSKGYCMVVTDQSRAHVTFGFDRLDWQLDRLGVVLDKVEDSKRELQTVNLMVQRNVPVTFVEPVEELANAGAPVPQSSTPSNAIALGASIVKKKAPVPARKALPLTRQKEASLPGFHKPQSVSSRKTNSSDE